MNSIHVRRLESRVARTAARFVDLAAREQLSVADLPGAKLSWYAVRDQADTGGEPATVFIFDEIGGSFGVDAKTFAEELQAITAPTIHVRINSPGGSVFDAIAIHSALRHHPAQIVVYVDSLAASAASVIAMAGDEVVMMPGSQMMIHDASAVQDGNATEMAKMSTFLDRQSDNIADMYRLRAGGDISEWRDLMLAETWLFAREAVAAGLADRVEERSDPDPDPQLDDLMTRSFDLSQFRYAGREQAPQPARRRQATIRSSVRAQQRQETMPSMTIPRSSSDAERRHAARLRTDAAGARSGGQSMAKRKAPVGLTGARMAAFPARLRATLVQYNGQQRYHLVGHASVVDVPYEMWDTFGPYMEVIERGAFDKTLAADPDVAFLVNHRGVTMARTTNDSLRLSMDDVGLAVEAWLNPKRQDVSDLVVAIEDRDITEMSFAFMLADDGGTWSPDFTTFGISEVDINRGDVSSVNYGANPYTDVAARSREILADLDRLPAGAARAAVARLQARQDVGLSIDDLYTRLGTPVPVLDRPAPVPAETAPAARSAEPGPAGRTISHVEALLIDD